MEAVLMLCLANELLVKSEPSKANEFKSTFHTKAFPFKFIYFINVAIVTD